MAGVLSGGWFRVVSVGSGWFRLKLEVFRKDMMFCMVMMMTMMMTTTMMMMTTTMMMMSFV